MKEYPAIIHLSGRLTAGANALISRELLKRGVADIVPAHGDILVVLFSGDGVTMTDLAVRTHRTKATVSILVAKLEKLGYVQRRQNETDRRSSNVFLTDKGKKLKPVFQAVSREISSTIEGVLSEDEVQMLQALLTKALTAFAS